MSNLHLPPSYQDPVMVLRTHPGRLPTPESSVSSHLQSLCTQGSIQRFQGLEPCIFEGPYSASSHDVHVSGPLPGRPPLFRAARGSYTNVPVTSGPWGAPCRQPCSSSCGFVPCALLCCGDRPEFSKHAGLPGQSVGFVCRNETLNIPLIQFGKLFLCVPVVYIIIFTVLKFTCPFLKK